MHYAFRSFFFFSPRRATFLRFYLLEDKVIRRASGQQKVMRFSLDHIRRECVYALGIRVREYVARIRRFTLCDPLRIILAVSPKVRSGGAFFGFPDDSLTSLTVADGRTAIELSLFITLTETVASRGLFRRSSVYGNSSPLVLKFSRADEKRRCFRQIFSLFKHFRVFVEIEPSLLLSSRG